MMSRFSVAYNARAIIRSTSLILPRPFNVTASLTSAMSTSTAAERLKGARSGSIIVWGRIDEGRLGRRFPDSEFTVADLARPGGPAVGPTLLPSLEGVVSVVARASKSLALLADGSVWSWGSCDNFSLGHGGSIKRLGAPKRIEALNNIKIVHVSSVVEWGREG